MQGDLTINMIFSKGFSSFFLLFTLFSVFADWGLDPSFGNSAGIARTNFNDEGYAKGEGRSVIQQANGKLVVIG